MYGTTAMFLASGRIPESDKGVQFALTGAWAKNKRGAGKKGEEKIFEVSRAVIAVPETENGVAQYISQNCKGYVAKTMAKQLAARYPFPFPVIHTDYFRTPTRSQSDDGPRRYRHSAGAQQERKREKKKGRNGAPRRNRLTKAQPGTYPTTKRRRKRAYDTKMRRMWERI